MANSSVRFGVGDVVPESVVDAKGDLLVATAADTVGRLPIGANDEVPVAASGDAEGIVWQKVGNAQVATNAAIAYSKLNLAASIVDADVASAAAISRSGSKIAGAPSCKVTKSANQKITRVTWTLVTWDVEEYDTDGFHDNVTNNDRITIPTGLGGRYEVGVVLANEHDGGTAVGTGMSARKNGTGFGVGDASIGHGDTRTYVPGFGNTLQSIVHTDLVAGDYLKCWFYHEGTDDADSPRAMASSVFFVRRIGP